MPLLKRKPFSLAGPPNDLEPNELVYQVRFTKEIFRDYREYLNRINLYRQRVWTCKVTGKLNLTYEEALVSEKRATEKVQQLPKELVTPALQIIQYSMLSLKDLADTIAAKLQEHIYVGAELYARKDNSEYLCRILKVVKDGDAVRYYKVARLDRNKKVIDTSYLDREDLIHKKPPYSRSVFKSFIRESTYRSAPWVLHNNLAQKHGISTELPPDLKGKVFLQNGLLICGKKRKKNEEGTNCDMEVKDGQGKGKRSKLDALTAQEEDVQPIEEPIRYPIDDLLVKPSADDPAFTDRPVPSRDFNIPMECFGDLLMVWDFCASFGRLLQLSPYSLEDFESAICHDKGNVVLLVETHSALIRLLIKDNDEYLLAVQKRNRNLKITLITWTEYLCDLLEMIKIPELSAHAPTIKRGHYGLLSAHAKLGIFQELVNCAVETDILREKLDEIIEQRHAVGATVRGEAIEEARKKREKKEQLKAESVANGVMDQNVADRSRDIKQDGNKLKGNGEVAPLEQGDAMDKSESNESDTSSKKMAQKLVPNVKIQTENGTISSMKEALKRLLKDDEKEGTVRSKEERKEYYEKEMEKRFVRTTPLGKDRHYNRYWWFRRDGRIFVESSDSKQWGYYSSKGELDGLMGSLNCKGEREKALKHQLEKFYGRITCELQKRSKELTNRIALEEAVLRRSTRVRAPPRENPANAFLKYVNRWKED